MAHTWPKDNLWKQRGVSFYHMGFGDQAHVGSLGSKYLCPLSHLISLDYFFTNISLGNFSFLKFI